MICNTPPAGSTRVSRARAGGFTLTELLVVIGIIVLLLGIAGPMITRSWRAGDRARMQGDLAAISSALEAYRTDHGDYPQVASPPAQGITNDFDGARMLCRALIGPGPESAPSTPIGAQQIADGKGADTTPPNPQMPGPGFRTRGTSGRVYGPYLPVDRFKLGNPSQGGRTTDPPGWWAILDKYNKPILYFPAYGKPNIRLQRSYAWDRTTADKPMYNYLDNRGGPTAIAFANRADFARMLGDGKTNTPPPNGMIDGTETPAYEGPYLLWSAGPDETFGPAVGQRPDRAVDLSDDITNFRQ